MDELVGDAGIARVAFGGWIWAMMRMRWLQRGHASTSISNTRRISSAQEQRGERASG